MPNYFRENHTRRTTIAESERQQNSKPNNQTHAEILEVKLLCQK
jgi:hypothetical protein